MRYPTQNLTRRSFLKRSTAYAGITIIPAYIALGNKASGVDAGPNEKLNLAVIGIGNRGDGVRKALLGTGLCNVVALCDIDMVGGHTHEARYVHGLTNTPPPPKKGRETPVQVSLKARGFTDFRKMFDEMGDEIDAVLIATPDHSHFSATMLAMSLGKHVYVEKPLAHTYGQCARLINLSKRSGVVTQMGNQGHSGANYFQFKAWSEAGIIKDVTKITAYMNEARRWHGWGANVTGYPADPMPDGINWDQWNDVVATEHPYSRKLHPGNWRCWHEYGSGAFGDWGPHILDTCHRFLKLGLPERVTPVQLAGANDFIFPQASTIRFDFPSREGMPPCEVTWYDGVKNQPEVEPEYGELISDPATGIESRKPVELKRPGKIIYSKDLVFQGDSHARPLHIIPKEKFLDMRASLPRFSQKNSSHFRNFLLACRGEEEARSPFRISGPLCQVFNLGMISQRLGVELEFDAESQRITNSKAAQALLDPTPRKGWEEFYRL